MNPNRRETHCWCLSHRLPPKEIEALGGGSREKAICEGAVAWAASQRAVAVEAYPVDAGGDTTMAFVGTRAMFEAVDFEVIGTTDATGSGLPRVVMRRTLSET